MNNLNTSATNHSNSNPHPFLHKSDNWEDTVKKGQNSKKKKEIESTPLFKDLSKNTSANYFHVNLKGLPYEKEDFWLAVDGERYNLKKHTPDSRLEFQNFMADTSVLDSATHYSSTPLQLPPDQAIRVNLVHSLNNRPDLPGTWVPSFISIILSTSDNPGGNGFNAIETAKALIFHHPDLMTKDAKVAEIIMDYMDERKNPSIFGLIRKDDDGLADVI